MAGRGRGRGHRMTSFSVEVVGVATPSNQQPTPVFPVIEQKPLPLTCGEEAEYLLALKQEFRGAMKNIPSFIQPAAAHRDVERYSDKYHSSDQTDGLTEWTTDWRRLPKELRVHDRKPSTRCAAAAHRSNGVRSDSVHSAQKRKKVKEKQEVLFTLENLEKKEEEQRSSGEEEEEEKKKKQEEEEVEGEEEYDEEEFEEETDYIMSYFDNGEDFGGESDDNMDEAIY